ncbi:hypothetical protein QC760_000250 [Botrytis cinerea]
MPWLSRNSSPANSIGDMMAVQSPIVAPAKISPSSSMAVTVIPSIIDPTCGTSPAQYRHSTMEVFWNSMHILSRNLYCIPQMMGSFTFSVAQMIPKSSGRDMYEMGIQLLGNAHGHTGILDDAWSDVHDVLSGYVGGYGWDVMAIERKRENL